MEHSSRLSRSQGKMGELLEFLRWDALVATTSEPGTTRSDVWHVPGERDAVYLYEAYTDSDALAQHQGHNSCTNDT